MFVSVVIPLYNKQVHILRTINSVLTQTHSDFELIVVDDGSTDKSLNIVNSIKDPRIRVINQPNQGVSFARNNGVRQAKADWVAFLDADDEYLSCFLSQAISFIHEYAEERLSLIGGNYLLGINGLPALDINLQSGIYDFFELFRNQRTPNHSSTTVVCKRHFLACGGFPEGTRQFEDWCAWIKLAFIGKFGFISQPLGIYNRIEGSVSRSERPAHEFYSDAAQVPKTILAGMKRYPRSGLNHSKRLPLICLNEFVIAIAAILAQRGEKMLALKLLSYYQIGGISAIRRGRMGHLFTQLVATPALRDVYRKWKLKKER